MKPYEKPIGEKIMEAIILTLIVTGTAWFMYGIYQTVDLIFVRGHLSC
jgi:hypothetical protein